MTEYLARDDLLVIAIRVCGQDVRVLDYGLLESAVARPRTTVGGEDAYPDLHLKAAALLHSLARNHALVDGNKRLAWAACLTFLGLNDYRVVGATEDERVEFVIAIASGEPNDLERIAGPLRQWSREYPTPTELPVPPMHQAARVSDEAEQQAAAIRRIRRQVT